MGPVSETALTVRSQAVPESDTIGSRLPIDKVVAILKLYDAGHSPHAIHQQLHSDTRTIGAVIRRYRDRAATAKALLAQSSIEAASEWLKAVPIASARGDHRPAKELLQAVSAIAMGGTGQDGAGAKVQVNVVIGIPGQPIPYDPVKS